MTAAEGPEARTIARRTARAARAAFVGALAPAVRRGLERTLAEVVLPHLGPPAVLGAYVSMGDEIDPAPLIAAAVTLGWRLAFPRVVTGAPLSFHATSPAALRPGFRGIPEPDAEAPLVTPEILLVPLLAVDARGHRLGQGGGHYDRTLAALRARGRVLAIGLAWDIQRTAAVPVGPWDQPLDAVATPTGFHAAARIATSLP